MTDDHKMNCLPKFKAPSLDMIVPSLVFVESAYMTHGLGVISVCIPVPFWNPKISKSGDPVITPKNPSTGFQLKTHGVKVLQMDFV